MPTIAKSRGTLLGGTWHARRRSALVACNYTM